jgi:hypothetical protein
MNVVPYLFSGPMVCALVEGRKGQTRRLLSPLNSFFDGRPWPKGRWSEMQWTAARLDSGPSPAGNPGPYLKVPHLDNETAHRVYPRVQPGDLIWVKETYVLAPMSGGVRYYATDDVHELSTKKSSIFMPRIFSRLTLEVTDVRLQGLQDISEEDAKAEGCNKAFLAEDLKQAFTEIMGGTPNSNYRCGYAKLWDDLNAKPGTGWYDNPWIVAVTFNVHKMNVDRFLEQRAAA